MKRIQALLLLLIATGCTPAFVNSMHSAGTSYEEGRRYYQERNFEQSERALTSAIDDMERALDQRAQYRGNSYLTYEGIVWWDDTKYLVQVNGHALRGDVRYELKKNDVAFADVNWVIDYFNKNGCAVKKQEDMCKRALEYSVYNRGRLYHDGKEYAKAIEDYTWVVKNNAEKAWDAYLLRGRAHLGAKQFTTAIAHFTELVKKFPKNAEVHALLCLAKFQMQITRYKASPKKNDPRFIVLLSDAVAHCEDALAIDPNNKTALTITSAVDKALPKGK